MKKQKIIIAVNLFSLVLFVVVALYFCNRFNIVKNPCEINAPMEQAQCRTMKKYFVLDKYLFKSDVVYCLILKNEKLKMLDVEKSKKIIREFGKLTVFVKREFFCEFL